MESKSSMTRPMRILSHGFLYSSFNTGSVVKLYVTCLPPADMGASPSLPCSSLSFQSFDVTGVYWPIG
eukprot:CAMPEP_0202871032 /NCGR_PEP_ID=MMETSP1391-20130828/17570_1 /ASSEMBLY_ACC=CAM_ASM_000867 /TAXON_ID=1034604 /ORGANISM="Chlamydomonas leiostraca, Strain SAG 11-49" /LENGTH=67 /DNA_ID=CAMNT_0049551737 /DNA_START=66 /DNA_END=265 /DNA_ORIENTATION=-